LTPLFGPFLGFGETVFCGKMAQRDGVFQGAKITTKLALGGVFYHSRLCIVFGHFWGVQKHPFLVFWDAQTHSKSDT
jgi:hypothetical protein